VSLDALPGSIYIFSLHMMAVTAILEFNRNVRGVAWNPQIAGRLIVTLQSSHVTGSLTQENGFCYWEAFIIDPEATKENDLTQHTASGNLKESSDAQHQSQNALAEKEGHMAPRKILPRQCWDVEVCEIINVPSGTHSSHLSSRTCLLNASLLKQ
jgi:hypothetical protein